MMPDLGPYATYVLGAYAVALVALAAIVALSVWQARRTRAALAEMEAGRRARESEGVAAAQVGE
jgi:heme exporter protein D